MRTLFQLVDGVSLRVAGFTALLLPLVAAGAMAGPWSPWALQRADEAVHEGHPSDAIARYELVAQWALLDDHRADALYRGGVLSSTQGDGERAARLLRTFTAAYPTHPQHADALATLGVTLGEQLENPARGARKLERSVDAAPEHSLAGQRLLLAAEMFRDAHPEHTGWRTYERVVAEYPEHAPAAWVRMAGLRLEVGDPVGALEVLYDRVLASAAPPEVLEVAYLGRGICLEDVGDFEAALAELDELPDETGARRRERLEARDPR